jgi:hypothetical protein
MDTTCFLIVMMTGIIVIAISYLLDYVWASAMPLRGFYYFIRAPGVVIHECAHILGCFVTGAQIREVVFFSKGGGSVTHTRPLLPWIGDMIISTAPLFAIPLVLSVLTRIFSEYLGCTFPPFPPSIGSPDTLAILGEGIISTFRDNLVTQFNGWFLLFLYLTISLVLSAAPSTQDMKNAAIGFGLLVLAGIMIATSGIPLAENLLGGFMHLLGIGFSLGLVYGIIALAVSSPLIVLSAYRH